MLRFGCSCYMIKNVRAISNARLLYTSLMSKDDEKDSKKENVRKITSKVQVDPLPCETEADIEESSVKSMSSSIASKLLAGIPVDDMNTSKSLEEKAPLEKKQALSKQGKSYGKQLESQEEKQLESQEEKQLDSQDVLRNSTETVCNNSQKEFDIDCSKDLNVLEVGNDVENELRTQKVFRDSAGREMDNIVKKKSDIKGVIEESTEPESSSELNHEQLNQDIELKDNHKLSPLLTCIEGPMDVKPIGSFEQFDNISDLMSKKASLTETNIKGVIEESTKPELSSDLNHKLLNQNLELPDNYKLSQLLSRLEGPIGGEPLSKPPSLRLKEMFIHARKKNKNRSDYVNLNKGKQTNLFSGYEISSYHEPSLLEIARKYKFSKKKWHKSNKFKRSLFDDRQWKYPIDNEQDIGIEEETSFLEHVFLDHYLDQFPDIDPIRKYMQLVITGLQQNPYLSVEEKRKKILWHKDYFENFSAEDFELLTE